MASVFLGRRVLPFTTKRGIIVVIARHFVPYGDLFRFVYPFIDLQVIFFVRFVIRNLYVVRFMRI